MGIEGEEHRALSDLAGLSSERISKIRVSVLHRLSEMKKVEMEVEMTEDTEDPKPPSTCSGPEN